MINEKDYLTCWCPECGHQLNIDTKYAGKTGRCKYCGKRFTVPTPTDNTVVVGDIPGYSKPNKWLYILGGFGLSSILFCGTLFFLFTTQLGQPSKEDTQVMGSKYPIEHTEQPVLQETFKGIPIETYYSSMLVDLTQQLLDPDSLQIDNVYYSTKGNEMMMIFDLRSKNSFGGYAHGWVIENGFGIDGSLKDSVHVLDKDMAELLIPALLKEENNIQVFTPPR